MRIETVSGTVEFRTRDSVYTEIQAGSYIFMDTAYNDLQLVFKSALFVATTVMSVNEAAIIVDAGRKSIAINQKMPCFRDYPGSSVKVSEEHCAVMVKEEQPSLGDRLLMVRHCCATANLYDYLYLIRQGKVIDRVPITSRGKSV